MNLIHTLQLLSQQTQKKLRYAGRPRGIVYQDREDYIMMLHERASFGLSYTIHAMVESTPLSISLFGYFILSLSTRDEDYTPLGEPTPRGFDEAVRYSLSLILGQPPVGTDGEE